MTRSGPFPALRIEPGPLFVWAGLQCWVPGCSTPGEKVAPHTHSNCELSFPGTEAGEGWGEGRLRQHGCVPDPGTCGNQRCWKNVMEGGCAQELLLAGKSFSPREEPGQQVTPRPPFLPIALGHLDHSPLAVVPYPLWEEDCCLRGHLGEWVPSSAEVHIRMGFPVWDEQGCAPRAGLELGRGGGCCC